MPVQCHEIFFSIFPSNKGALAPIDMPRKFFEFCQIFALGNQLPDVPVQYLTPVSQFEFLSSNRNIDFLKLVKITPVLVWMTVPVKV